MSTRTVEMTFAADAMRQYLVVERQTLDDVPVLLTTSEELADRTAKALRPGSPEVLAAETTLGLSEPIRAAVYIFNAAGRFVDCWDYEEYSELSDDA